MNIERLQKLSTFLRELPPRKFDFGGWANRCGTMACALGWACIMPEFKALGLKLKREKHSGYTYPVFGQYSDDEAGAKFFGLTLFQSENLFMNSRYYHQQRACDVTAVMVADKIDQLIASHLKRQLNAKLKREAKAVIAKAARKENETAIG